METRGDWGVRAAAVAGEIGAHAAAHDDQDSFVSEGYAALAREGFFKALVPEEFGGGGASAGEIGLAIRTLGAACSSTALAFSMHSHLVATAAWRRRHQQAPTEGLLRKVGEGAILLSSGGSDWLSSGGEATRVEGGYRVTARKPFSSGSPAATILVTSAVYDDPAEGETVIHFAVPLSAEGVSIAQTWRVMGMRGTGSNDVILDNVFVADAAVSGRRPRGPWHPLFHAITMVAIPIIYSAYVGVAKGARDRALALAKGRPADDGLIMTAGEMDSALTNATVAHNRMLWLADHGTPGPDTTNEVMQLRTIVGDAAIRTVERAIMVGGGGAFYRAKGLERAFRDVQAARFHPLQEKAQLALSGRLALGLDIDG
jgi:acyl-CoA dehydrogenase